MRSKTILLYASDEERRGLLSFLLQTKGFDIVAGVSELPPLPDLGLFVDDSRHEAERFAKLTAEMLPDLALIVLVKRRSKCIYPAQAMLLDDKISAADLVERIRCIVLRKRGPGGLKNLVAASVCS